MTDARVDHAAWTRRRFGRTLAVWPLGAAGLVPAHAGSAGPWVLADGGRTLLRLHADTLAVQQQVSLVAPWAALLAGGASPCGLGADGTLRRLPDPGAQAAAPVATGPAAVSADGRWVCAVEGDALQLRSAALAPLRRWTLPGPVAWLTDLPLRQAFVLAFATRAELWQLSYDERAESFYDGLVHDYRLGEGVPTRAFHHVRRMPLPEPLLDASPDAEQAELAGRGWVFHLDARRRVCTQPLLQPPTAGCGAALLHGGVPMLALPVREQPRVDLYRTADWERVRSVALPHPADAVLAHSAVAQPLVLSRGRLHPLPPTGRAVEALDGAVRARPRWRDDGADLWVLGDDGVRAVDTRRWQTRRRQPIEQAVDLA